MFLSYGQLPKISCLLVTAAGRFQYFCRSVKCYIDQTYPNRELVVVNEGPPEYQRQIEAHLANRQDVRLIFLDGKYTLGALRNIAVGLSHGDVFVQWDDDDFNAPERLAVQYNYLQGHPKSKVCYLSDQLHYYFTSHKLYWNDWNVYHSGNLKKYSLIPGTIMAYRSEFACRYPSSGKNSCTGEDSVLAQELLKEDDNVLLLNGSGHLYVYSYHGSNVWDLEHHVKISKDRALPVAKLLERRDKICSTLDYLNFEGQTMVMGRDGLAFIHGDA